MKLAAEKGIFHGDPSQVETDDDELLTDYDVHAILCRDGMGGFGGVSWEQYQRTPDRVIAESYFAERDDKHTLITYRQRRRRILDGDDRTGRPDRAGGELPSRKVLRIPPEAWQFNSLLSKTPFGQSWVLMYWSVWRRRQSEGVLTESGEPISDAYILERFKNAVKRKDNGKRPQDRTRVKPQASRRGKTQGDAAGRRQWCGTS